jgi:hypothetical protein
MSTLIATVGMGKGTWGHLARIIAEKDFDDIILVSTDFGKENFKTEKPAKWITTNPRGSFEQMMEEISSQLGGIKEASVSIISGSGREHMALLATLKQKKIPYSLILITKNGIEEF